MEVAVRTIGVGTTSLGPTSVVENGILFRADVVLQVACPCAAIHVVFTSNAGIIGTLAINATVSGIGLTVAICVYIESETIRVLRTETNATQTKAEVLCAKLKLALIGVEVTCVRRTLSTRGRACTIQT